MGSMCETLCSPREIRAFKQLVADFCQSARNFPWRQAYSGQTAANSRSPEIRRDPYRVWISEIMLQQTQAQTVVPYFERFLEAFPDVASLARAPEEAVLKLWSGLGYYSRARNLQRAARILCEQYGGQVPATEAELRKLPGLGSYSVGAILSFAYNQVCPAVDANVLRVLARFYLQAWRQAEQADRRRAEDFWRIRLEELRNQDLAPALVSEALIELGASHCQARRADCGNCPLASACGSAKLEDAERLRLPLPKRSVRLREQRYLALIIEDRRTGSIYMEPRPPQGLLAGQWQCPLLPLSLDPALAEQEILRYREELETSFSAAGWGWGSGPSLPPRQKRFSHLLWRLELLSYRLDLNSDSTLLLADSALPYSLEHESGKHINIKIGRSSAQDPRGSAAPPSHSASWLDAEERQTHNLSQISTQMIEDFERALNTAAPE